MKKQLNLNKKKKNFDKTKKFKEEYFQFYDDIKSYTHNIVDWWNKNNYWQLSIKKLKLTRGVYERKR